MALQPWAGGTALAAQLGHRISQDLDLFANAETFGDEYQFGFFVMNQHDIGVAVFGHANGLSGAHGDDAHVDAALLCKVRQDEVIQAGIFG